MISCPSFYCREMINAPARRIDEILALPYSADNFRNVEVPPSDNDAWLYDGEDELNSALLERQKEMDSYDLYHKKSKKSREQEKTNASSSTSLSDLDPADLAKTMQAFVQKVSSYEGAEVPENRFVRPKFYFCCFYLKASHTDVLGSHIPIS